MYVRMHVCLYCMCVRVCVLMMKRLPLVWDSGRATNAKIRKRERKAMESGDGRFLLRAAMDEGRIDARGMGDGRDGYFLDSNFFWREARKRRREEAEVEEKKPKEGNWVYITSNPSTCIGNISLSYPLH